MERKEQPDTKHDDDIEKGPGPGRDPETENPGSKDGRKNKDKQQPDEQVPAEDEQEKE
jgi:hypothetical protein